MGAPYPGAWLSPSETASEISYLLDWFQLESRREQPGTYIAGALILVKKSESRTLDTIRIRQEGILQIGWKDLEKG